METVEFWNRTYAELALPEEAAPKPSRVMDQAINFFRGVAGKRIIDLGCGAGKASLYLAHHGATVLAVDNSPVAIDYLKEVCQSRRIAGIHPMLGDAMSIDQLGPVDGIFGSMVLHHVEPFADFAACLERTLPPGGRGFFRENSAASRLLIWFRSNLVGRLWIPKRGDSDEFPLTPQEIDVLRHHFDVRVDCPEMLFFRLAADYLLGNRGRAAATAMDEFCFRHRIFTRYSYRQVVMLTKPV